MFRGTTPLNKFDVDLDLTEAVVVYVTYSQNDTVVLEKTKEDLTITPTELRLRLSQADTLKFDPDELVEMQIRARFQDGNAVASTKMTATVMDILKDGEI